MELNISPKKNFIHSYKSFVCQPINMVSHCQTIILLVVAATVSSRNWPETSAGPASCPAMEIGILAKNSTLLDTIILYAPDFSMGGIFERQFDNFTLDFVRFTDLSNKNVAAFRETHLSLNRLWLRFENGNGAGFPLMVQVYGRSASSPVARNADLTVGSLLPNSRLYSRYLVREFNTTASVAMRLNSVQLHQIEVRNMGSSSLVRSQVILGNSMLNVRFEADQAELIFFTVSVYDSRR